MTRQLTKPGWNAQAATARTQQPFKSTMFKSGLSTERGRKDAVTCQAVVAHVQVLQRKQPPLERQGPCRTHTRIKHCLGQRDSAFARVCLLHSRSLCKPQAGCTPLPIGKPPDCTSLSAGGPGAKASTRHGAARLLGPQGPRCFSRPANNMVIGHEGPNA